MNQSTQSATARRLDMATEESGFEADVRLRIVKEAVDRALTDEGDATTTVSGGQDDAGDPGSMLRMSNSARQPQSVNLSPRPPAVPPRATLSALQEWEGYVVDIGEDKFAARLTDLAAGHSHESEEAEIPLTEISESDASRMVVGSIFRWVIGYERSIEGTRRRISQIVFRDLPRMTEGDLRKGREWAESVVSAFER